MSTQATLTEIIDAEAQRHVPIGANGRLGCLTCFHAEGTAWPCPTHKALSALRVTVEALETLERVKGGNERTWRRSAAFALAAARKELEP